MTLDTSTNQPGDAQSPFSGQKPEFPVTRPDYTQDAQALSKSARKRQRKNLAYGLGFLAPNILGFLAFTAIPLVIAMYMAFTNWDVGMHNNPERREPLRFVGLENFIRLIQMPQFWQYLGNTLFFMMGMPFSIAGSLFAAILLSKDLKGGSNRTWTILIAGAVLVASTLMLVAWGASGTAMAMLIAGLTGMILIGGTAGGTTVYRTLFYVPHFTAGVATYLLWKKLFVPDTGPIAAAVQPVLTSIEGVVRASPPAAVQSGFVICMLLGAALIFLGLGRLRRYWEDGEIGAAGVLLSAALLMVPVALVGRWYGFDLYAEDPATGSRSMDLGWGSIWLLGSTALILVYHILRALRADHEFVEKRQPWLGVGTGLMFAATVMVAVFVMIGLGPVFHNLPTWATTGDGLKTPAWLADVHWAKPSLMIMGFWGAIGSNNMLLYLAALTNVPQELYEAADIDGASRFQRFWSVTWPQLAPTTFFVVVMGVIGGLQGGFEMARVMTQGGPAGQTTTLAYFIYKEGFETGRLGFSSAVAWTLFLMVFVVTLFNWKFGNKYVND